MRKYLTLLLLLFISQIAYEQQQTFTVQQIDSLADVIDSTKGLKQAIDSGKIRSTDVVMPEGNFSETYYVHPTTGSLVKVVSDALFMDWNMYTYYFYNNQVVLITAIKKDEKGYTGKTLATGRYYFRNNELIEKKLTGKGLRESDDLLQRAKDFIRDVKTVYSL